MSESFHQGVDRGSIAGIAANGNGATAFLDDLPCRLLHAGLVEIP
jgi:hypothetical protein